MDTTECLGLPYPQCDPPLTKDASDVEQIRDLAFAVDTAVQGLDDSITNELTEPDAVRMLGNMTIAGQDIVHNYTFAVDADNAGMANTTAGYVVIQTDGWYMLGGFVRLTGGGLTTTVGLRVEPLVNGEPISSRQGPGFVTNVSEDVTWTDCAFLRAGDILTSMSHHTGSAATLYTYNLAIWALLVLANV